MSDFIRRWAAARQFAAISPDLRDIWLCLLNAERLTPSIQTAVLTLRQEILCGKVRGCKECEHPRVQPGRHQLLGPFCDDPGLVVPLYLAAQERAVGEDC